MTDPEISIILCTHNRAGLLRGALASLASLATDGQFTYEIVVIDNASSDDTAQVIREAAAAPASAVRGVYEANKGIVPARNRGIREARGRWIAFFDDDQLADERWLAELYREAGELGSRVVGGAVHLRFTQQRPPRLHPAVGMLLGEARFGNYARPYGGRLTPGCGNLMIERTVFDEVGVFERTVDGRGEDTDLFSRIERAGIAAWYVPTAIVHHLTSPERLQPDYLLGLARRMGEGIALRQHAAGGSARFAVLVAAKALRLVVWQWPLALAARLRRDYASALGRGAVAAINASFVRHGVGLLLGRGRHAASAVRAANPVAVAPPMAPIATSFPSTPSSEIHG